VSGRITLEQAEAHATPRDLPRIERVTRALAAAGLDAVVCALPSNVLLLTGYWPVVGTSVAVATREGAIGLVAPEDERELAAAGWADPVVAFAPASLTELRPLARSLAPALDQVLRRLGIGRGRIGFEHGPVLEPSSYAGTNRYVAALPDLLAAGGAGRSLVPADEVLLDLRAVLTERELAGVRAACRVAEDAFRAGAGRIVPGATEREVAAAFRAALAASADAQEDARARAGGFVFCMSGPEAALADRAYARSRGRLIEPGDFVLVHCNSFVNGLWTDITRTYHPGQADRDARILLEAVLDARRAALGAIAPGVPAREVDRAARDVLAARGLGHAFHHGTGHGVGFAAIDHHARPRLHPASDEVLEAGMVFNVEPAVYLAGRAGVRQCDVVALHSNGIELLTPFHQELAELAPHLAVAH
jgi:Xaa-Pro aminopeptidase